MISKCARVLSTCYILLLTTAATTPTENESARLTTVAIPAGTVVGTAIEDVEYYRGIPYAEAPVGPLRLRAPVRASTFDNFEATGTGPSCPQMTNAYYTSLVEEVATIPEFASALSVLQAAPNVQEDCLTISVMRPKDTPRDAKLPILFWIYGGGYETGASAPYNGSVLIPQSVDQGTPMILVTVNYRLNGFGFLPGKEVLAEGISNLGLLDQRMALEWVADNIGAFGGDPDKVTIWGQSAGAYSVFNQMALYGGNITYKGKDVFRAGIMNSGTILPTEAIDSPRAQAIFDTVALEAGCGDIPSGEKLDCLRGLDFDTFYNATNSVPPPFSYHSPASSYTVRADGVVIPFSPEISARDGLFANVPVIVGDQEDEGTFLSLTQNNLTTTEDLYTFLHEIVYQNMTLAQIQDFVATYPYANGTAGSPFRTGSSNVAYPQFKRMAALLGDMTFTLARRAFLNLASKHGLKAWSYLGTYGHEVPILGTFHTQDLPAIFYRNDDVARSMQTRYIAFVNSLDPNEGRLKAPLGYQTEWPEWDKCGVKMLEFGGNGTGILRDDFRGEAYEFIVSHLDALRT
ncbi:alpha/beta-hydrolase [Xylariaceae sp. FL1019]|nr:alpha/beta-hydrolase [Xylariaceae sp. FL1019]